jgi:hypothetical protein
MRQNIAVLALFVGAAAADAEAVAQNATIAEIKAQAR